MITMEKLYQTKITCVICNKLVERLEIFEDYRLDQIVFVAICHGEVDRRGIERIFLQSCPDVVLAGYAFDQGKFIHDRPLPLLQLRDWEAKPSQL